MLLQISSKDFHSHYHISSLQKSLAGNKVDFTIPHLMDAKTKAQRL